MITNTQTAFTVSWVSWQQAEADLRSIREHVFIQEQQVPVALEWDGLDADCQHLLAQDSDGQAIATARLLMDGHIGRMAVLPQWRKRGVGTALLTELLRYCRQHHLDPFLDAQNHALEFYRKMGFIAVGDEFLDAGIPHHKMIMAK